AGRVEIAAVLPGSYAVDVQCEGFRAEDEYAVLVIEEGAAPPEQRWTVREAGGIRGSVRSADGAPIPRAQITARRHGGGRASSDSFGRADSAVDGSFEMSGLRAGSYEVEVEPAASDPVTVTVTEGSHVMVELRLAASGGIAGEVVDERGQPVAGVSARARFQSRRDRRANESAYTGDDGKFTMSGLEPGSYRVSAQREGEWDTPLRAPGKRDDDPHGERVEVAAGRTAAVRLVVESMSGVIRGRVVDAGSAPITDAFVEAERESESATATPGSARQTIRWSWMRKPVLTDTDGNFAIEALPRGKYTVRAFRRGGGESLAEGVNPGATLTLTIRRTGSVAGTVRTPGGSPERMHVTLNDAESGLSRRETFFRTRGQFLFRDLPAGTFDVMVEAAEGTGKTEARLTEGQDLTGLTVELAARATITGRVVSLDGGGPLPGFMIRVSASGPGISHAGPGDQAVTDQAGRFRVENAPAGKVEVIAFPRDREAGYSMGARRADVTAGRATDIGDVRVARRRLGADQHAGELGFTLVDRPDGQPAEVTVGVVRPGGPAAASGLQVGDVIVSVDGQDVRGELFLFWSLVRVPAGTTVTLGLARGGSVRITAAERR
ncbi:MAG TPA: carboxypeptidase regulatory-like domain-containing protein, partial [Kofleriaceae bacterium]|nr:carboxypeptidase regulatory-like domain-containing protein [Kofleriaceae bacterium]